MAAGSVLLALLVANLRAFPAMAQVPASTTDQVGQWGPLMDFRVPATHQVLMRNGKVLYWRNNDEVTVWDPTTGSRTRAPAPFPIPPLNIHCSGHAVLPDGRVLVLGGQVDPPHTAIKLAAIFDPATSTWTRVADMNYARWYPTATVLADGRVLVSAGEGADGGRVAQLEIYDPQANTWTVVERADRPEDLYSFNYLLPDGRIFNATPSKFTGTVATGLLDLAGRALGWTAGPAAHWRTGGYSESAVMYRPGKILRSGGTPTDLSSTNTATNRAEIVDMTSPFPAYVAAQPMAFPRRRQNLTLLADGTVMAAGGTEQADEPQQAVLAGEIWNPDSGQWRTVAAMAHPRMYHSAAILLPDGRVLAAGGEPATAGGATARTAQVYSPPYLFKGPRPTITGAPARIGYGTSFTIATPDVSSIASVALIRPSSVTHANNMEQRYVPLAFAKTGSGLTVTSPPNGNWAPPGFYMLVVKNTAGVPSVASWVQVAATQVVGDAGLQPGVGAGEGGGTGADGSPGTAAGSGPSGNGSEGPGNGKPTVGRAVAVTVPARVHLRSLRRIGLRIAVRINVPLRFARPALRVRVYRVHSRNTRRLVTTTFRAAPRQGLVRVTVSSPALGRLRAGRYEVVVAIGSSRVTLGPATIRRFTVTRR